jgi:hypothetical protein
MRHKWKWNDIGCQATCLKCGSVQERLLYLGGNLQKEVYYYTITDSKGHQQIAKPMPPCTGENENFNTEIKTNIGTNENG